MSVIVGKVDESVKYYKCEKMEDLDIFRNETEQTQANFFCQQIKNHFVSVGDEKKGGVVFFFNSINKLWQKITHDDFRAFSLNYFNNTVFVIKKLKLFYNDDSGMVKLIDNVIKKIESIAYVKKIHERCLTDLKNDNFLTMLDADANFLSLKNNKKIDLRTLEVTERTYKDLFTYECPVDYIDDETKTPNANKFFSQFAPKKENREYLRKILGYQLSGWMDARVFFIWHGHGSNGKSKIFNIMEKILQHQYVTCDKSIFMKEGKKSAGTASPEIMALVGKRVGVYSEGETSDNIEMNNSGLKQISGEDKLQGRALYGSTIEFYPIVKMNLLSNFIPRVSAEKAMDARFRIFFCDTEFTKNPTKPNEIKIDKDFAKKLENEYLSEVFSWIVKGAKEYYTTKEIEPPQEFEERTKDLYKTEDSIYKFISDALLKTNREKDHVTKKDLMDAYKKFCDLHSMRCSPRSTLYARMDEAKIKISESKYCGYDVYRGLIILDNYLQTLTPNTTQNNNNNTNNNNNEIIDKLNKTINKQNDEIEKLKKELQKYKDENERYREHCKKQKEKKAQIQVKKQVDPVKMEVATKFNTSTMLKNKIPVKSNIVDSESERDDEESDDEESDDEDNDSDETDESDDSDDSDDE